MCAVVVTYNRAAMLERCLAALAAQTRPVDTVLVVDNASTDGTAELVSGRFPHAELVRLPQNVGGAGGFHHGLREAHARGFTWAWLMDDDTFAEPGALEALLDGGARVSGRAPLVLASQVRWKDGTLHPMNLPVPRWRAPEEIAAGIADGLVALRNATFVSVLVRCEAVDRFGLPLAHYFIWTDDVEYTSRVLRDERGFLVPESVVHHWTATPHTAASAMGDRFYYHVRNSLLLLRGTSLTAIERLDYGRYYLRSLVRYFGERGRWRDPAALRLVARGLHAGMRDVTR